MGGPGNRERPETMPILHVYGIDHSRASLAVREQLAFSAEEAGELIPVLLAGPDPADCRGAVREAMLLSTCNRTEVYLVTDGEPAGFPLEPLCRHRPEMQWLDNPELRYHLREQEASAHLFAVAASLRSQVPGDTQIASQVAAAAAVARSADTLGPLLEQVVARALRSAKRVRRETGLMAGSAGTGAAVLQALRRMMPDGPRAPVAP